MAKKKTRKIQLCDKLGIKDTKNLAGAFKEVFGEKKPKYDVDDNWSTFFEDAAIDDLMDLEEATEELNKFTVAETGAKKDQKGKMRVDLIAPEMEEALAEALEAGVRKGYGERNWEKGLKLDSVSISAARRHILKWRKGIDIDEETGVHHLKLALINIAMAVTQIERGRTDLDDRPSVVLDITNLRGFVSGMNTDIERE